MAELKSYRAKRDFAKTQEPRGDERASKTKSAPGKSKSLRYVIQKHAASRLHYDLRLELDGVMMSWAITRGPSLVPGDKRLAIHTEDHPIEYNTFEGTIPQGQYGGGTVMVWDVGSWNPEEDAHRGMKKGHLDFAIDGMKLKGRWHLVRMRKRPGERQEPWLLIKSDDEHARGKKDPDILEEKAKSVTTGRSMERIASDNDRQWQSNRGGEVKAPKKTATKKATEKPAKKAKEAAPKTLAKTPRKRAKSTVKKGAKKSKNPREGTGHSIDPSAIPGARRAALPDFVEPALAALAAQPPGASRWLHEIKFDGYRLQARILDGRITLKTRTGLDWTAKFRTVAQALAALPVSGAIIDGEVVVETSEGVSSFSALQEELKAKSSDFRFYAFDLMALDGYDLTRASLSDRKAALHELLGEQGGIVRFSEHFNTEGASLLKHACGMGLEGIISKRADAPYRAGRGGDWVKTKCLDNQEFVIAGYEPSATQSRSIRALILAYRDEGEMKYAGRVGTGFTQKAERDLVGKLRPLHGAKMPFAQLPEEERRRKVTWVTPKLVAEIDFRGWTHGDVLRQASFKGLREDKPAEDVVREKKQSKPAGGKNLTRAAARTPAKAAAKGKAAATVFHGVTLTHPDRVYWKDANVTKEMLAAYYESVWKLMAPHVADRPLALLRCPDGAESKNCFFQKHVSAGLDGKKLKAIPQKGEQPSMAFEDISGLMALVQAGVLEIHIWGTNADDMETCNRLVFDLDPGPGVAFKQLAEGARDVRARLQKLKLKSFLKTTGGKGLHVVVPIAPAGWDHAKAFSKSIADAMAADDPAGYVAVMTKAKRTNRIFVDYLRNGRGSTAIAPYSTRAREGAPVSVPIEWTELDKMKEPNTYTVLNLKKRLASSKRDPWAGIGKVKQTLPKPLTRERSR